MNRLSNTGKTLHQTLVSGANTSSNTSVSFMLIKQSPSPTKAPDWFIAFHLRSQFRNSSCMFDHSMKTLELVFEVVHETHHFIMTDN